jgi:SpoVK/Ycf46/Vps4 family AAA+-type ATPase
VSYLLQRIEDSSGLVVLASNLKDNIDDAFARRFQSMIYFGQPKSEERRLLWKKLFASPVYLESDVSLDAIAEEYEITGGGIVNVLRYASLMSLRREEAFRLADFREGVRREFHKDGRVA